MVSAKATAVAIVLISWTVLLTPSWITKKIGLTLWFVLRLFFSIVSAHRAKPILASAAWVALAASLLYFKTKEFMQALKSVPVLGRFVKYGQPGTKEGAQEEAGPGVKKRVKKAQAKKAREENPEADQKLLESFAGPQPRIIAGLPMITDRKVSEAYLAACIYMSISNRSPQAIIPKWVDDGVPVQLKLNGKADPQLMETIGHAAWLTSPSRYGSFMKQLHTAYMHSLAGAKNLFALTSSKSAKIPNPRKEQVLSAYNKLYKGAWQEILAEIKAVGSHLYVEEPGAISIVAASFSTDAANALNERFAQASAYVSKQASWLVVKFWKTSLFAFTSTSISVGWLTSESMQGYALATRVLWYACTGAKRVTSYVFEETLINMGLVAAFVYFWYIIALEAIARYDLEKPSELDTTYIEALVSQEMSAADDPPTSNSSSVQGFGNAPTASSNATSTSAPLFNPGQEQALAQGPYSQANSPPPAHLGQAHRCAPRYGFNAAARPAFFPEDGNVYIPKGGRGRASGAKKGRGERSGSSSNVSTCLNTSFNPGVDMGAAPRAAEWDPGDGTLAPDEGQASQLPAIPWRAWGDDV